MNHDEPGTDRLSLSKSAQRRVEAGEADVNMSAVGMMKTDTASLRLSSAGLALAGQDASMSLSTATVVAARHDAALTNSGGQWILAGNDITVKNGGAAVMAARTITLERGGAGLVIAAHAELGEGARALLDPRGAASLAAGFGAGALFASLLFRLLRRRR